MCAFNNIDVSNDKTTVTIGSGALWGEVTQFLEAQGLAIAGGRDDSVGVGGLTLGGKFQPQRLTFF